MRMTREVETEEARTYQSGLRVAQELAIEENDDSYRVKRLRKGDLLCWAGARNELRAGSNGDPRWLVVKRGSEAGKRIIESQMPLVGAIARNMHPIPPIDLDDLVSEGYIGVMDALARFKPELGWRFSTYASWWIRRSMAAWIRKERWTDIPERMYRKVLLASKTIKHLTGCMGRRPTKEELADHMEITLDELEQIGIWMNGNLVSLSTPVGENGVLEDFLHDRWTYSPGEAAIALIKRGRVDHILQETLNEREVKVLKTRFGIDHNGEHTLEEIGQWFGVTRERVRQMEMRALRKLRHPDPARQLRCLWES